MSVEDPPNVEGCCLEVDLLPARVDHFCRPQPVPVGQQDHERVPVAVPVAARSLDQLFGLMTIEVLAGAVVGIFSPSAATVQFSVVGGASRSFGFPLITRLPSRATVQTMVVLGTDSRRAGRRGSFPKVGQTQVGRL